MSNIQIQYSQSVVDQNHADELASSSDGSLSALLDTLIQLNYAIDVNYYYFNSWSYIGNTLRTNFSNGATRIFTGSVSDPNANSGTANATNVSFVLPNTVTVSQAGSLNYRWQSSGKAISFYSTDGNISSFIATTHYPTTSPYYDAVRGNSSIKLVGEISFDSSYNLSGSISSFTVTADKYLKNLTLTGNFAVGGNETSIGQGLANSTVAGTLTSYSETYYDGSYINVDGWGGSVYLANKQPINMSLLSDASHFPGDDTISIALPPKIYESCLIASGAGNDRVTLKGGGILLSVSSGSGKDNILLLDHGHSVDGGSDLDVVGYQSKQSQYQIQTVNGGVRVSNTENFSAYDTLINIERLNFSDSSLALDLDANAGKVAKLLGVVFGKAALMNKAYVGIGLSLLDGGLSYEDLAALALSAANATSSTDICTLLWTNVFGKVPTAVDIAPYKTMLDSGRLSIGALTTLAADTSLNITNIDLVGLAKTGIEYA